jgi:hypothetical protein
MSHRLNFFLLEEETIDLMPEQGLTVILL